MRLWPVHHTSSLPLIPPQGELLTPAPAWDPSHVTQSITNFSSVGLLPMGYSYSLTAPARVSHRVTGPTSQSAPVWAPLSMETQVLLQHGLPWGHSLLWAPTCPTLPLWNEGEASARSSQKLPLQPLSTTPDKLHVKSPGLAEEINSGTIWIS